MKNLITYLKALWSRVADSQSTDVSVDRRLTVGSPSGFGSKSLLKFVSVLALILTIGSGNAWGTTIASWGCQSYSASTTYKATGGDANNDNVASFSSTKGFTKSGTKAYFGDAAGGAVITFTNLNLSGYTDVTITFYSRASKGGNFQLAYSTNGGSSWTNGNTSGTLATKNTPVSYSISFPSNSTSINAIKLTHSQSSGSLYFGTITISGTAATTYNVYLMSGCTGGSYTSNKGTSGSGTGTYSSCTKYSGISSGTSVTITATPTSGYQFDGWTNGGYSIILDDESNEITPSSTTSTTATFTMPSSDVVIWDCNFSETCANTMTINKGTATNCTFSLGTSGSGIASCSGVSSTVTVTPNTGYGTPSVTQSGASKTPTITGSGTSWTVTYPANTTGTSTINVSCSANNYTITLNTDLTPTSAGTTSITATYNANTNLTSAITKPTKTGWTFGGYFTAKNGGGTQIIDASGNVIASVSGYTDASRNWKYAGSITLYAKWTCTVTWSVNGLTNVYSTQTVTYNSSGSKVASVPTPDPASYCGDIFAGWSQKNAGSESKTTSYYDDLFKTVGDSPDIKNIGNITFYAVFADEE